MTGSRTEEQKENNNEPGDREHKVRENHHCVQVLTGTVVQVTPEQCSGLNSQEKALTILRCLLPR